MSDTNLLQKQGQLRFDDSHPTTAKISQTLENYLFEVYQLWEEQHRPVLIDTSELYIATHTTLSSVNRSVTKLADIGLLEHQRYQGVRLTDAGLDRLKPRLRRHRIAEAFLVQVMGFDWHEVYAEAYHMSSGMCEAVTGRMFILAGKPACCPRGHPIPETDGAIKEMLDYPLHQVAMKTNLVITRILTCDSERLKYIGALQLLPDTQLQVIQIAPFNGPLQLKLNDTYRIIGHHLADSICACTLTDEGEALVPT